MGEIWKTSTGQLKRRTLYTCVHMPYIANLVHTAHITGVTDVVPMRIVGNLVWTVNDAVKRREYGFSLSRF